MNTTYGVFSAYYVQNNYFEGGSTFRYAWVGGLSVATALACGPLANLLCRVFGLRVPMVIGTCLSACTHPAAPLVLSLDLRCSLLVSLHRPPFYPSISVASCFCQHRHCPGPGADFQGLYVSDSAKSSLVFVRTSSRSWSVKESSSVWVWDLCVSNLRCVEGD